jgi:hypothetical protein
MGKHVMARKLIGYNKVTLEWILRYQGMPGNKEAD